MAANERLGQQGGKLQAVSVNLGQTLKGQTREKTLNTLSEAGHQSLCVLFTSAKHAGSCWPCSGPANSLERRKAQINCSKKKQKKKTSVTEGRHQTAVNLSGAAI